MTDFIVRLAHYSGKYCGKCGAKLINYVCPRCGTDWGPPR